MGCRTGCEFCTTRGSRYLERYDPNTFDTLIRAKVNAVKLLRKRLPRLERDIIAFRCG